MNFDGTYPDNDKLSSKKFISLENIPSDEKNNNVKKEISGKPPVRVIVSYPQAEEWDGVQKSSSSWTWHNWKIWTLSTILIFLTIAIGGLIFNMKLTASDPTPKLTAPNTTLPFSTEWSTDNPPFSTTKRQKEPHPITTKDVRDIVFTQIKTNYQKIKNQADHKRSLQFFENEQERLKTQPLNVFVSDFDTILQSGDFHNEEICKEYLEDIQEVIDKSILWLKFIIEEEEKLSSYEVQSNRHEHRNAKKSWEQNWSEEELKYLRDLRDKYTQSMGVECFEDMVVVSGQVVVLKEVEQLINGRACNSSLVLLISQILYLDVNITGHHDMAIFSHDWRYLEPFTFDVRGSDAIDLSLNVTDGQNGQPGEDGAFFFGVSYTEDHQLTVLNEGGRPSDGHNGENGRNGTIQKPPNYDFEHPTCYEVLEAYENNMSEGSVKCKVFENSACGQEGGLAGKAGDPGRGGVTILVTNSRQEVTKAEDGAPAKDGSDGRNGTSADAYCHYGMFKMRTLDKWKWQRITKEICNKSNPIRPKILPRKIRNASTGNGKKRKEKSLRTWNSALREFSSRARQNYDLGNDASLFNLLQKVENLPVISNTTTCLLLFEEFNSLMLYTKPRILESFQNKLENFLAGEHDTETKLALNYLNTALWSRLTYLKNNQNDNYIVDIAKYLDYVLETVQRIDHDVPKVPSLFTTSKEELSKQLSNLESTFSSSIFPQTIYEIEDEKKIVLLTTTLYKTLPYIVKAMNDSLFERSISSESIAYINYTISEYEKISEDHSKIALRLIEKALLIEIRTENDVFLKKAMHRNRTAVERIIACEGLMLRPRHCDLDPKVVVKWKNLNTADYKITSAIKNINTNSTYLEISSLLKLLQKEIKESLGHNEQIREFISDFRSRIEELLIVLTQCKKIVEEDKFMKRLSDLISPSEMKNPELKKIMYETQEVLVQNLLDYFYRRAFNAYEQWLYPYNTNEKPLNGAKKPELIAAMKEMKTQINHYRTTVYPERDSELREADFMPSTTTGSFYTWPRSHYQPTIDALLQGRKVYMRASLSDSNHLPNKQAIKLRTVQVSLSGVPEEVLQNFHVDLVHSGFSHFYYNGSYTTIVGPQVKLYYSFDRSVHNIAVDKLQKGDTILSPFTTWGIQLIPQKNSKASLEELATYSNFTDIELIGHGRYSTMPIT